MFFVQNFTNTSVWNHTHHMHAGYITWIMLLKMTKMKITCKECRNYPLFIVPRLDLSKSRTSTKGMEEKNIKGWPIRAKALIIHNGAMIIRYEKYNSDM